MARLDQMAKVIRSKNAGPFCLTLDVLFDDPSTYEQVQRSGAITRETMASLYRQPAENVEVFYARAALAIKVSLARWAVAGSVEDSDIYGAQHHVLLYDIEIA